MGNLDFYNIGNMNLDKEIDLIRLYLNTEKAINYFSKITLPDYLKKELISLSDSIMKINDNNRIYSLAKLFIMLFDSIPLIKDKFTDEEKEFLFLSKKYLSLCYNKDSNEGKDLSSKIMDIRLRILDKEPEMLNFG